jgi:dethiobiotin synthetase
VTPLALIGTDTGVGKTHTCLLLARALRALGRQVWLHKPVACGDWDGTSSDDGRRLRAACGDGQDPAVVCPCEFPEPCSPHLAAAAAGATLDLDRLADTARRIAQAAPDLLLLETAGGLLSPLGSDRRTNADLLATLGWPALVVTRPHLGTLNHTALTVAEARRHGIPLLGLVVNHHQQVDDSLAVRSAAPELTAITALPLLAEIRCGHDAIASASAAAIAALLDRHGIP